MTVYSQGVFSQGGPHTERTSKFAVIGALDLNNEPDASVRGERERERGGGGGKREGEIVSGNGGRGEGV